MSGRWPPQNPWNYDLTEGSISVQEDEEEEEGAGLVFNTAAVINAGGIKVFNYSIHAFIWIIIR